MPDVILPVMDEVEALPWVLDRMPGGYDPVVVDNGSTDGSWQLARKLGARVVHEPRPGFGAACYRGVLAVRSEVICFMDADGSLDPVELPLVALPVLDGDADLVLGAREPRRGAWPLHARLANRAIALELRRRGKLRLRDIGPMRATRRTPLLALGIIDRRFGWPLEMVLRASDRGWRIQETAVSYRPRIGGQSKVSGSWSGTLRAVRDMAVALS